MSSLFGNKQAWTFNESMIFIDDKWIGLAQNVTISISYRHISYPSDRNSAYNNIKSTLATISVNITSIHCEFEMPTGSTYFRLSDFMNINNRDVQHTIVFGLLNEEHWSDECVYEPSEDFDELVTILGKIQSFNIQGRDNELILSNMTISGSEISFTLNS